MITMFSRYEISFITIFKSPSRMGLIDNYEYLTSTVIDKGKELFSLTQTILAKLKEISDEGFASLDLRPDFQELMKIKEILAAFVEPGEPEARDGWDEDDDEDWDDWDEDDDDEWDNQDGLAGSGEWDDWDEAEEYEGWEERSLAVFSDFEITLMSIFDTTTRMGLISALTDTLSCLPDTETELRGLIRATLTKLRIISDDTFDAIGFDPDWQDVWELAETLETLMEEC